MNGTKTQVWHGQDAAEVVRILGVDPAKGLTGEQAAGRLLEYGPNVLSKKREQGPFIRFLLQFHQPLIYILLAAAAMTAYLREWVDSSVILGVVIINAVVGFIQEAKALKSLEALSKTMVAQALVLRDGEEARISSEELVPGDIVILLSGDKVAADMRLLEVRDLQINESSLTGESVPVEKASGALAVDEQLAERRNMAYASTLVTYGRAKGVVVATGDASEIGRISMLIQSAQNLETPLTRKISRFSHILLIVILALSFITFLAGVLRGQNAVDMFMAAVALAVSAIPEGLPAAVTITLAIGVSRMAKRQAIVRKLPAVETLGSTTVICSDKTGTLTKNEMTVQTVRTMSGMYAVEGAGYAVSGKISGGTGPVDAPAVPDLRDCLLAGMLCNDSRLIERGGMPAVDGDPTEGALIVSALKAGITRESSLAQYPRIDAIPFESQNQYMATLHRFGDRARIYMKGGVEAVLERCSLMTESDGTAALDRETVQRWAEDMASSGVRVLAFARRDVDGGKRSLEHSDLAGNMVFVGLQGMIDPPRPEAVRAIENCHTAGIRVKMITGDHPNTASAIAAMMRLNDEAGRGDHAVVAVTGRQLASISDEELPAVVDRTDVFARTTPEQKLKLVKALQSLGHIVAMTGDGVNDAPALKQSDIGVAMGRNGTEVAKESADMVLTDDNFASIEAAVEEGRGVYDNLRKFIIWTLPTNLGEGLAVMIAIFGGLVLPVLPVQILWINMTTAVFLGMMLAFEAKEPGIMTRPPYDPRMPIMTRGLTIRTLYFGILLVLAIYGLFGYEQASGSSLAEARTVAVTMLVFGELFYLFNCRSLTKSLMSIGLFSNPWAIAGSVSMAALQALFIYAGPMNTFFHSAPISAGAWFRIIASGLAISMIVAAEKSFSRALAASKKVRVH